MDGVRHINVLFDNVLNGNGDVLVDNLLHRVRHLHMRNAFNGDLEKTKQEKAQTEIEAGRQW